MHYTLVHIFLYNHHSLLFYPSVSNIVKLILSNIYIPTYRKSLHQHNCKHHQSALNTFMSYVHTQTKKKSFEYYLSKNSIEIYYMTVSKTLHFTYYDVRFCNFKPSTCFRITSNKCRINTVIPPDDGLGEVKNK